MADFRTPRHPHFLIQGVVLRERVFCVFVLVCCSFSCSCSFGRWTWTRSMEVVRAGRVQPSAGLRKGLGKNRGTTSHHNCMRAITLGQPPGLKSVDQEKWFVCVSLLLPARSRTGSRVAANTTHLTQVVLNVCDDEALCWQAGASASRARRCSEFCATALPNDVSFLFCSVASPSRAA